MGLADALPDDPSTLKAMLLAERARAERPEQIIKELRRHRFGRLAETLPEDGQSWSGPRGRAEPVASTALRQERGCQGTFFWVWTLGRISAHKGRSPTRSKYLLAGLLASAMLCVGASAQQAPAPRPATPAQAQTTPAYKHSSEWRASKLIGVNVYNQQNEKIGDINEILLTSLKGSVTSAAEMASAGGTSVASAAGKVGSQVTEVASHVKKAASEALSAVAPGDVPGIAADTGEALMEELRSSAEAGKNYGARVQRALTDNLARQPLLLGAIGLAIGAGIASAFPSTQIENELMGEQNSAARAKLQTVAEETKEVGIARAQGALETIKNEAQAQGFTSESAKDTLRRVSEKTKSVAASAVTGRAS